MFCEGRKIGPWGRQSKARRDGRRALGGRVGSRRAGSCGSNFFAMALPMVMRLSPITTSPTRRCIPLSPLYRERWSPWRRLTMPMRHSDPVRHFCPLRNRRFLVPCLRPYLSSCVAGEIASRNRGDDARDRGVRHGVIKLPPIGASCHSRPPGSVQPRPG